MSTIQPGTIIHGTLRSEDLVPAFLSALREQRPDLAEKLEDRYEHVIKALAEETAWIGEKADLYEHAQWLIDELAEELSGLAPEGLYFGTIEGDGSDYGYWRIESDLD